MDNKFYKKYKLEELGFVGRGRSKHRPRNDSSLFGGEYPFIQTGDVKKAEFYLTEYSETYNETGLAQSKLWDEETLCITIAANIAETAILGIKACFPDSVIGFIPDKEKADLRFIKYCLETYKLQMQSISQGATQDNLSLEKLRSINFKIPPLQVQQRMSSILYAYDELINNYKEQCELLEKSIEHLYKEWFNRKRPPNILEVNNNAVPEGWSKTKLQNEIKIYRGKSYSSEELRIYSSTGMLNLKNIMRGGGYRRDGIKYFEGDFSEDNIAKPGYLIMAITDMTQSRDVIGRVALVPEIDVRQLIFSMDLIRLESKRLPTEFLYCFFRFSGFGLYIKEFANGANVLHLNPEVVLKQEVLFPNIELAEQFCNLAHPMIQKVDNHRNKIDTLREARDIMLRRLISGSLKINET